MRLAVEGHRQRGAPDGGRHVLLDVAPLGRHALHPALEQVAVVHALEGLAGVQQPQAHVGGAVADTEDPPVAGQQGVAVPQLQPGLQVVVVVAGALEVRPHRDAHRAVLALVQPHRQGDAGGVAVGGDHQPGAVGDLLAVPLGDHADDVPAAVVEDRGGDVHPLQQADARLDRVGGQDLVEVLAGAHQAEVGEARQLRPVELEAHPAADHAQALVADPAGGVDVDTHRDELLDRSGRQPVAADLLAGEGGLLEQQDVEPGLREVECGCRTGGPGADDDDVGVSLSDFPLCGGWHGHGTCPVLHAVGASE